MTTPKGLLVLGFGGHARAVADVALACGIEALVFFDVNARDGEDFVGHPVVGALPSSLDAGWACMPASGDAATRRRQILDADRLGWPVATLLAPTATLGVGASVARGSFVGHHAHVGPMTRVGEGCIINTAAVVEHECTVGDYAHVSVNATIAGRSRVGDRVFVGAAACVIDGIAICDDVVLAASAVACRSIDLPGVYVGVPARRLTEGSGT